MQKINLTILENAALIFVAITITRNISIAIINNIKEKENKSSLILKISKPTNLKNINQIYNQAKKIKRRALFIFLILTIIIFVLLFSFRFYLNSKTINDDCYNN